MLKRLAEQLVLRQIKNGSIRQEQKALYCYGYEALLNQLINILLACVIAIIFRAPLPVLVFLLGYIPLRSYSGGYHANTNGACTVVSALLTVGVCLAAGWLPEVWKNLLMPIGFLVSGIMILRFAPVWDKNKRLDEAETICYRRRSRSIWLAEVGAAALCFPWIREVSFVLAFANLILGIMLIMGVMKNRI